VADTIRKQYNIQSISETPAASPGAPPVVAYYGLGSGSIDAIILYGPAGGLLVVYSEGNAGDIPDQHREGWTNFIKQKWLKVAPQVTPKKRICQTLLFPLV